MAVTPPSLAQGPQKLVRVAMVRGGNPGPDPVREAFVEGMRALGYVEGQNIVYAFRYAAGNDAALLRQHMHEVVHLPVDIIVTGGTPAGLAARAATHTIPIVLSALADPVAVGLAASMARPGGNVMGFTTQEMIE
jgi:putative ABC transport system substrate-binding protein